MRFVRWRVLALLSVVAILQAHGQAQTTAQASAQITLRIPIRATFTTSTSSSGGTLCLHHMPFNTYQLFVRDLDAAAGPEMVAVNMRQNCMPVSESSAGKVIFIVAE